MIAAYAFLSGALAGFIEGKLYSFGVRPTKLPPLWIILLGLFTVPLLSIGVWTEFSKASWRAPVIIFACEIAAIIVAAFREEIRKRLIDPYPPLSWIRNKLIPIFAIFNSPASGYLWVKRPWKIVVERAFIPFAVFFTYLLIVAAMMRFVDPDELAEMQSEEYQLIFFLPGYIITSTYIVWQRWKEEVQRR